MTTLSSIRNAAIEDAGAGGLTVYATKEDLPTSGLTAGDQAYVSANSRLYVSNGSGWYNVALINATPSLSIDPTGTISLSTTGETTTITLTATDSDNAVAGLTYSVESDGSFGGLATLSQDSSVFTITPLSEDSATTSSAVLTFKASDGINFGSGDRTLTLSFKVENSNYTTLLLKNEETTDNQVDASTNALTITEYGNTTSTALSPYHPGGYSTYFDGSDRLNVAASSTLGLTGDFTVEFWLNYKGGNGYVFFWVNNSGSGDFLGYGLNNGTKNPWLWNNANVLTTSTAITNDVWQHHAVVRSGSSLSIYLDGVEIGSTTNSTQFGTGNQPFYVGWNGGNDTQSTNGYIKDLRVVNGTAVYTSAFTPPTEPLTAIANTSLLTCHLPYIADGSSNDHAVTVVNNTSTKRFGPFDYLGYTKGDHGGSVYFDGSGDYFQIPDGTYKDYGEDDFTFECWIYPTATGQNKYITSDYASTGQMTTQTFGLLLDNSILKCYIRVGGVNVIGGLNGSTTVQLNVWHHVALVRNGNVFTLYLDGESEVSLTQSGAVNDSTNPFTIGRAGNYPGLEYQGYIADARLVKGTAVYTAAFTPPTAPLTAITNTQLLTCTNKNDIWEQGSGSLLTKGGNATSSNTQRKFTTSSAMYFDGSGDSVLVNNGDEIADFKSGDFTIEFWLYMVDTGVNTAIGWRSAGGAANTNWVIMYVDGLRFSASDGSSYIVLNLGDAALSSGQWYHTAVTRNGNTFTMWIDGSSVGTATSSSAIASTSRPLYIGYDPDTNANAMNGYIQDVRITKGLARYTSNFTPPTAEFDG